MMIQTVDYQAKDAPEAFARSLKETGFAILKNHPVDMERVNKIYEEWSQFLASEMVNTYVFDEETQEGFASIERSEKAKGNDVKDLKEFFDLRFPDGRYPREVSSAARQHFYAAFELAKQLASWLAPYLPEETRNKLDGTLADNLSLENSLLRILRYPPLEGTEDPKALRSAEHADINMLTILPAASEVGLQAQDLDGKWVDISCDPGSLVINAGDMLEELSGQYLISTKHRVVNGKGHKERMSIPTFVHIDYEVYLSDRYPVAQLYFDERCHEIGLKTDAQHV